MTSTLHPASTVGTRTLSTRRPHFEYGERLGQRHFVQGDLISSHLVAVLSTLIPEGEWFVVDAVKRYRSEIDSPELKKQANAFVGQESMHQREHDRLNDVLRAMGYPTRLIERIGAPFFWFARQRPQHTQLALTASIEHWTAVLAEHVLERRASEDPIEGNSLEQMDLEVSAMIRWHLIEEIEHKSVAFDVMQALGTSEEQRISAMRLLNRLLGPLLVMSMAVSFATDRAAWNPRNVRRSLRWLKSNSAMAQQGFLDDIWEWFREGFHPDERDHRDLLERARAEAFGPGSIVEQRSRHAD